MALTNPDRYVVQSFHGGRWHDVEAHYTRESAVADVTARRASEKTQATWEKEHGYSHSESDKFRVAVKKWNRPMGRY